MRVFKNESIFNQETQDWEEYYSVDGTQLTADEYSEQVEIEELATEEDEIELDDMDNVTPCDCDFCVEQRRLEQDELEDEERNTYDCSQCEGCEDPEDELENCYCSDCNEIREDELISKCLDVVFDSDSCIDCTIDKVIETMYRFKVLGMKQAKTEMQEFLED